MKISFGTKISKLTAINNTNGYGYATNCMLESLQRLGYHVAPNDASADVEIWFDQPQHWNFSPGPYRIGYHPWESTKLQKGWVEIMNQCDEIWTPSPLIADWYRADGVTVPVHVYEHGIEHVWTPQKRTVQDKVRFLHVGAEAARKGGWDVLRAFRAAFLNRDDVELTMKMINSNWVKLDRIGKTTIINRTFGFEQLKNLFYEHNAYIYPSWGEGFGLTPLQAIASGMPAITVPNWAPYERFLDEKLSIDAKLHRSPWQEIHPGKMFRPNFDDMVDKLRYAADNYEQSSDFAMSKTDAIHHEYDWDTLTSEMFSGLENRLK